MRLYRNESYSRLSILNSNTFNIEWYCRSQCDNALFYYELDFILSIYNNVFNQERLVYKVNLTL